MHFVRKLCGDFAAILRRFLQNQQQFSSNLVKFNLISFTESKSKTPVSHWLTGVWWGCPDGLEPSTFRTTSKLSNLLEPLYLSAFQRFCILLLRQFCNEFSQSCNLHNFKFRNFATKPKRSGNCVAPYKWFLSHFIVCRECHSLASVPADSSPSGSFLTRRRMLWRGSLGHSFSLP